MNHKNIQAEFEMYEEELRNLQNDLNQKDQKITQLEKEQKQLYKKYKSLKGKSKGIFDRPLSQIVLFCILHMSVLFQSVTFV